MDSYCCKVLDSLQRDLPNPSKWINLQQHFHSTLTSLLLDTGKKERTVSIVSRLELGRRTVDAIISTIEDNTLPLPLLHHLRNFLLVHASIVPFLKSLIHTFYGDERIISRISTLVKLLCSTNESRDSIGGEGCVDSLTITWKSHLTCIPLIDALACLSSSHVDNISRSVRNNSINIALHIITHPIYSKNLNLILVVTKFLSMCTICIPDDGHQSKKEQHSFISIMLKYGHQLLLKDSHTSTDHQHSQDDQNKRIIILNIMGCLANIVECHLKEGQGYYMSLTNIHNAVEFTLDAWLHYERDELVSNISARALASILFKWRSHAVNYISSNCTDKVNNVLYGPFKSYTTVHMIKQFTNVSKTGKQFSRCKNGRRKGKENEEKDEKTDQVPSVQEEFKNTTAFRKLLRQNGVSLRQNDEVKFLDDDDDMGESDENKCQDSDKTLVEIIEEEVEEVEIQDESEDEDVEYKKIDTNEADNAFSELPIINVEHNGREISGFNAREENQVEWDDENAAIQKIKPPRSPVPSRPSSRRLTRSSSQLVRNNAIQDSDGEIETDSSTPQPVYRQTPRSARKRIGSRSPCTHQSERVTRSCSRIQYSGDMNVDSEERQGYTTLRQSKRRRYATPTGESENDEIDSDNESNGSSVRIVPVTPKTCNKNIPSMLLEDEDTRTSFDNGEGDTYENESDHDDVPRMGTSFTTEILKNQSKKNNDGDRIRRSLRLASSPRTSEPPRLKLGDGMRRLSQMMGRLGGIEAGAEPVEDEIDDCSFRESSRRLKS